MIVPPPFLAGGHVLVVLAPDSFKGSLPAPRVCAAMLEGVRRADPGASVRAIPMADGGEGTVECLINAWGGAGVEVEAPGPLGAPVLASYGRSADGRTAVVELAAASGLVLTEGGRRDPLRASTRGTGVLLASAIEHGARAVVLGLGGSATTDGGTGLLRALGFRFLDGQGRDLPEGGAALVALAAIDDALVPAAVRETSIRLACDVTHPLVGPRGAAAVFGPQKGADPAQVEQLDRGLARLAEVLTARYGRRVADLPGAGAAGGTAGGLVGALGAQIEPGATLVADAGGLPQALEGADLVLTGEGRVDDQSAHGKVVSVVVRLAAAAGVPAVAIAGAVAPPLTDLHEAGLTAAFSVADGPGELSHLVRAAPTLVAAAAEQVVRLHVASQARHLRKD